MDSLLLALLWYSLQFCLFYSQLVKTVRVHILTTSLSPSQCGLLPLDFIYIHSHQTAFEAI